MVSAQRTMLLAVLAAASCAQIPLERRESMGALATKIPLDEVPLRGFVVRVRLRDGSTEKGELLAIDPAWIALSNGQLGPEQVVTIPRAPVEEVEILDVYVAPAGLYGALTAFGALSAISHGYFAIATVPAWLAVGVPLTIISLKAGDLDVPRDASLSVLAQYARFPQGLPASWQPANRSRAMVRTASCS